MRGPTINVLRIRRRLGLAVAIALPVSGALAAVTVEEPASAAEFVAGNPGPDESAGEADRPGETVAPSPTAIVEEATLEANTQPEFDPSPDVRELGVGNASYYGVRFAGRPTASGERFDPSDLTAAHRTLPFGSRVKVTNRRNGKSVVVRINDRGPFHGNRVIDLSRGAAEQIGLVAPGHGLVELVLLSS